MSRTVVKIGGAVAADAARVLAGDLAEAEVVVVHGAGPQISAEIQEICQRYGLDYNTGPLHKQLFSVAKKICRFALPGAKNDAPEHGTEQQQTLAA